MIRQQLLAWEERLTTRIVRQGQSPWGRLAAQLLSRSGDIWLWLVLALVVWVSDLPPGSRLLWALVASAATTALLKFGVRRHRPRPGHLNIAGDQYAFPSGHAARAAAVAMTLALTWPTLAPWLFLWAVAAAYARVMRTAHYLFDVIAGLLLGLLIGWLLNTRFDLPG